MLPKLKLQESNSRKEGFLEESTSEMSFLKFGWLCLKFTFTELICFVLWDVLGIMVGLDGVAAEFASFGLFLDTTELFYSVFNSISYLMKMILAH